MSGWNENPQSTFLEGQKEREYSMTKSIRALLVSAALSGFVAGASGIATSQTDSDKAASDKATSSDSGKKATKSKKDKHACKGTNSCKGKGGCGSTKGKNECKGKGECRTDGKPMPKEDTGGCGGTGDCKN